MYNFVAISIVETHLSYQYFDLTTFTSLLFNLSLYMFSHNAICSTVNALRTIKYFLLLSVIVIRLWRANIAFTVLKPGLKPNWASDIIL